jgi:uncharacterized protein YdbL (DUF1318 family)
MKRIASLWFFTSLIGLVAALNACVTVNVPISFPESAVQSASDDYVRDLYRAKEKGSAKPGAQPSGKPSASPTGWILDLLEGPAFAGDTFSANTDAAAAIKDRMSARVDDVIADKRAGSLGETNDGYLAVHEPKKLKPLLLKKLDKLVADENKDRKELYEHLVSANGLRKEHLKEIQKKFARSFQAESPSGTWVEDENGSWTQKP